MLLKTTTQVTCIPDIKPVSSSILNQVYLIHKASYVLGDHLLRQRTDSSYLYTIEMSILLPPRLFLEFSNLRKKSSIWSLR